MSTKAVLLSTTCSSLKLLNIRSFSSRSSASISGLAAAYITPEYEKNKPSSLNENRVQPAKVTAEERAPDEENILTYLERMEQIKPRSKFRYSDLPLPGEHHIDFMKSEMESRRLKLRLEQEKLQLSSDASISFSQKI